MAGTKIKAMLQAKEQACDIEILRLEIEIATKRMYVSRDQLRCWNKRIQDVRSLRIAIRTMISMVD